MTIKNGDLPAMPIYLTEAIIGAAENGADEIVNRVSGLKKREYFAALAMQGMLNGLMCNADSRHLTLISEKSVKAADALLAELERTK